MRIKVRCGTWIEGLAKIIHNQRDRHVWADALYRSYHVVSDAIIFDAVIADIHLEEI